MTDHFQRSVDELEQVAEHRRLLDSLYSASTPRPQLVAAHHDKIRYGLSLAKIHATLGFVQAVHDLRAVVESNARVSA